MDRANQRALVTLFAFRQRAQTYTRRVRPPSAILTRWRLGRKRRLVATIEWLRELPVAGRLPQLWHTLAIGRGWYSREVRARALGGGRRREAHDDDRRPTSSHSSGC